jgi:hypothetical protein
VRSDLALDTDYYYYREVLKLMKYACCASQGESEEAVANRQQFSYATSSALCVTHCQQGIGISISISISIRYHFVVAHLANKCCT